MHFIWPLRAGCTSSRQSLDLKRVKGPYRRPELDLHAKSWYVVTSDTDNSRLGRCWWCRKRSRDRPRPTTHSTRHPLGAGLNRALVASSGVSISELTLSTGLLSRC